MNKKLEYKEGFVCACRFIRIKIAMAFMKTCFLLRFFSYKQSFFVVWFRWFSFCWICFLVAVVVGFVTLLISVSFPFSYILMSAIFPCFCLVLFFTVMITTMMMLMIWPWWQAIIITQVNNNKNKRNCYIFPKNFGLANVSDYLGTLSAE